MGKPCFSKVFRYVGIAAAGSAVAIAIAIFLANPVAAHSHEDDGGGQPTEKNWDTDNLRFPGYTAANFRIPSHSYSAYSHEACSQGGIADGFYQTRTDVNDFPVLTYDSDPETYNLSVSDCDGFVEAQEKMVTEAATNGGFWLDETGALQKGNLPDRIDARPASLTYGTWGAKGAAFAAKSGSTTDFGGNRYYYNNTGNAYGVTSDAGYWRRVDVFSEDAPAKDWAIYPDTATLAVVWGTYTAIPMGREFYGSRPTASTLADMDVTEKIGISPNTGTTVYSLYNSRYLPAAQSIGGSGGICPAGFHPRGEDSYNRIGNTTGRTLSGLTHAEGVVADKYWCRTDLRFSRKLYPYTRPGVTLHSQADGMSLTQAFYAYGRINCFYTADSSTQPNGSATTGVESIGGSAYSCSYPYHPLPKCTDADTNRKREFTSAELGTYTIGETFKAKSDGTTVCGAASTNPPTPQQAGFDDDACVTATLEIYENRVATSDAEPGVPATDRTLTVAAGTREAYDLDITSPHPRTASPPRDTTAGTGDPSGCASGSEDRADHAGSPADAARKQDPAPSYAASSSGNIAHPPSASGDSGVLADYNGTRLNIAHRYASKVAENTCAAKRATAATALGTLSAARSQVSQCGNKTTEVAGG